MNIYDNYTHIKCECGGILGLYDREHCTCEKCKKEYTNIRYDLLAINDKNGWIFPMVAKNPEEHQKRIERAKPSGGNMQSFIYGTPKGGSRFVGNRKKHKIRGMKKR